MELVHFSMCGIHSPQLLLEILKWIAIALLCRGQIALPSPTFSKLLETLRWATQ